MDQYVRKAGRALRPAVKCSNFIGEALDMAVRRNFIAVLVVGHTGKLVKLLGGVMDTHSKVADWVLHAATSSPCMGRFPGRRT